MTGTSHRLSLQFASAFEKVQMAFNTHYRSKHGMIVPPRSGSLARERISSTYATTRLEQFLLMLTIMLLPLQYSDVLNAYSPFPTFPVMFILFALSGAYILLNRPGMLAKTWEHPVFLTTYAFLCLSFLLESVHSYASYEELFRIGQMIAGAVIVATLCRDRRAFRAAIYGYIIVGILLSIFLFSTAYSTLRAATVTDFTQASLLRGEAFSDNPLEADLNGMAFVCGQGAVAALALALSAVVPRRRYLFLGISLFCFVGAFLPLSRSGAVIVLASAATVTFVSKVRFGKMLLVACVFAVGIMVLIPDAVWMRMTFSTEVHDGKQEGRARIYTAFFEHISDYGMTGVGAGNYVKSWAVANGFARRSRLLGAHNSFFQVMIYWGWLGLLALVAVVWQAYRHLPKQRGDAMVSFLFGITVSLLLLMQVMHNLYAKEFSLGLGFLVAANHWVWPTGMRAHRIKSTKAPALD